MKNLAVFSVKKTKEEKSVALNIIGADSMNRSVSIIGQCYYGVGTSVSFLTVYIPMTRRTPDSEYRAHAAINNEYRSIDLLVLAGRKRNMHEPTDKSIARIFIIFTSY